MFTKENVERIYRGDIIGKEIIYFESVTSTNDRAIEIGLQREDPDGIVVIADAQTRGKGRQGRSWISPPGVNLYFTVLLKPPFRPNEALILPLVISAAVAKAVRRHTGLDVTIKWPNDILLNGRKTGGILMEMKSAGNRIILLAVGIGLNVNMPLEAVPDDIRPFTTSLHTATGRPVERGPLLGELLAGLEETYKILLNGDKRALINEWHVLNSTIGKRVAVRCQERLISGIADGINETGELIVRLPSGDVETLNSGDVTILKS